MSETSFEKPDPLDFLNIDSLLTDEEILLRNTVRTYVENEITPHVGDWWDQGIIPHEQLARDFGELGMLGMHLEGYGCAGTSATAYGLASVELEAGDSGIRSFVSVQGSLAMFPIWKFGSEEQKQTWLPQMAKGEVIGVSGSPRPTRVPIRAQCVPTPNVMVLTGSSTGPRCGSPTDRSPRLQSSGLAPTKASAAS